MKATVQILNKSLMRALEAPCSKYVSSYMNYIVNIIIAISYLKNNKRIDIVIASKC